MTDKRLTPDELADRLDTTLPPNQDLIPASDADPLVNLALRLAREPRPAMSPETMVRIRAQVLDAVPQPQVAAQRPKLRLQVTPLLRWAAVFIIAVFFFGSAMIPASASSLPGELLYPVKLGIEQIEIIAAPSPAALSVVHLNHAERRLGEAQLLLERGRFESVLLIHGWESLAASAKLVEQTPDVPFDVQTRAAQVNEALYAVLQQAEQQGIISPDEMTEITVQLPSANQNDDDEPLTTPTGAPTSSPEPAASPTAMPTATQDIVVNVPAAEQVEATSTPIPSLTPTDTTPTEAPTTTPVPTSTHVPTVSSPVLIEAETSYTATIIATRGVNVRSGPGTNFDIIAVLQPGSLVEVIGQNDDVSWLYVRLNDGRTGWIAEFLLQAGVIPVTNSAGEQTGDFGCEHPGNYCNAPGYDNPSGNNSDTAPGQGTGNANGNANSGGPPSDPGGGSSGSGSSGGGGKPPNR